MDTNLSIGGMDFAAPPRGGIVRNWLGLGGRAKMDMFPSNNEYASFVEVLKARCEIWNMEGGRDWRRREIEEMNAEAEEIAEKMREEMVGDLKGFGESDPFPLGMASATSMADHEGKRATATNRPKRYHMTSSDDTTWEATVHSAFPSEIASPIPWQSTVLQVSPRILRAKVVIPSWSLEFQEVAFECPCATKALRIKIDSPD